MKYPKVLLILLLLIVTISRLMYRTANPSPILNDDSVSYLNLGKNIAKHPTLAAIINPYRVPLYPGIIAILTNVDQGNDREIFDQLTFIQTVLTIIGSAGIFAILMELSIPAVWAFVISLFLSLNSTLFPLEQAIMTDSLAHVIIVGLLLLLVRLIKTPTRKRYIWFGIVSTLAWLLRPNLMLIPIVSYPILLFSKRHREFLHTIIAVGLVTLIIPLLFIGVNYILHGYAGISQLNEINILGRILEFNLPVEAGKSIPTIYHDVLNNAAYSKMTMPYVFINTYDPLIYVDSKKMAELQHFNRAVVFSNLPSYTYHAISYIPRIFSDEPPLRAVFENGIWKWWWSVYHSVWQTGVLVFFLWPIALYQYVRRPSTLRLTGVIFGLIGISQLLVIVFFDYYDAGQYSRLASIIQTPTYLFFLLVGKDIIQSLMG